VTEPGSDPLNDPAQEPLLHRFRISTGGGYLFVYSGRMDDRGYSPFFRPITKENEKISFTHS
jgi:hypothetical protein